MRSAIDRSSHELVPAARARRERMYVCPCCDAPVHLVRADTLHFAHHRGRARPDCEQYFPTEFRYGATSRRLQQAGVQHTAALSYLAFDVTTDGPELSMWLPPAGDPAWSGSIRLVARSATRTVRHAHLARGMRVPFPLQEAQWTLEIIGEVSDAYQSQLMLGRQSLELERNLFYASIASGRRIEVSDSIGLGDAFWWIRRSRLSLNDPLLSRVAVEMPYEVHGWRVYLVTLPDTASREEIATISQWLQRRVRPRRPVVWIASPWPRQVLPGGTSVFTVADGPLCWRADREIDLRVLAPTTGRVAIDVSDVTEFVWEAVETGEWDVEVNQVIVASIRVEPTAPRCASSVSCKISDGTTFDLVDLQNHLDVIGAAGQSSLAGELCWNDKSIGRVLRLNGDQPEPGTSLLKFSLRPGSHLDADKLGWALWPEPPSPTKRDTSQISPRFEGLVRWLLSVGTVSNSPDRLRLHASSLGVQHHPLVRQLLGLSWPLSLAAQVQTVARALGEGR